MSGQYWKNQPVLSWFTVAATREIDSETMRFTSSTDIQVLATDENDAMRKVRSEFRHHFLRVIP